MLWAQTDYVCVCSRCTKVQKCALLCHILCLRTCKSCPQHFDYLSLAPEAKVHLQIMLSVLQAAIEYLTKNYDNAKEALTDMPPRAEEELDPVGVAASTGGGKGMSAVNGRGCRRLHALYE